MKKTAKNKFTFFLSLSSLFLFSLFLLFMPSRNIIFSLSEDKEDNAVRELNFSLPTPASYPKKTQTTSLFPEISAKSYIVLDSKSDAVLLFKNKNMKLKIASLTKLMTALTALDIFRDDEILEVKRNFNEGAVIGLLKGDKLFFKDLLLSLLIPSANDAAQTLADNSKEDFVKLMNKKARALHLKNTLFTNPQGFDDGKNESTVEDMARLGQYALQFPKIKKIVNMKNANIKNADGTKTYEFSNVNQLLFSNPFVHGIKTGFTEEAGECLISLFEKDGHEVIIVVLKSEDRFGDTEKLADYAFSNFIWVKPLEQNL